MVLLPGMLIGPERFQEQARRAVAYATVVRLAIPGVHTMEELPSLRSFDFLADTVRYVLDDLGYSRSNVLGISYGGYIAHHLAHRHPDSVDKLMLAGTANPRKSSYFDPTVWGHLAQRWKTVSREEFALELTELLLGGEEGVSAAEYDRARRTVHMWAMRVSEQGIRLRIDCGVRTRTLTSAPVAVPVLAVTGEHDTWSRPEACRLHVASWPDAQYTTVSQSDHFLPATRPAEFAELARRFFLGESLEDLPYCVEWDRFRQSATVGGTA
ncbi:alpha/beta fold hydrolase [Streptomyces acidiscabies]|uniref:alpha/beta fold hydrolase n=1 Tax=Streptomyces acidiscabies TaxID=42234 RepID=UPI00351AB637